MLHCQRYAHAGECPPYRAGAPVADKPVFLEEATKGVGGHPHDCACYG